MTIEARKTSRPAPHWEPALSMVAVFGASILLTCVLVSGGGTHRLSADLIAFATLAAAVAYRSRGVILPAVIGTAWLFYTGFLVNRHANLVWHGSIDGWRLATIAVGGLAGALVDRVQRFAVHAYSRDVTGYGQAEGLAPDFGPRVAVPDHVPENW